MIRNSDNVSGGGQKGNFSAYLAGFLVSLVFSVFIFTDFFMGLAAVEEAAIVEIYDLINPNYASVGSLVRLPGVGPVRAEAIVKYREVSGKGFTSAEELANINGIGPKTVEKIRGYLEFD